MRILIIMSIKMNPSCSTLSTVLRKALPTAMCTAMHASKGKPRTRKAQKHQLQGRARYLTKKVDHFQEAECPYDYFNYFGLMHSGLLNNVWMIQKSKLSISLQEAEFSKDYQYMLTAQFENQKVFQSPSRNKLMFQPLLATLSSSITTLSSIYTPLIQFKVSSS